jgi:hypothetical protein
MKANELRIGNLFILPNGDIGKISYHEIRLMVVAIEKPDYQPIPLTEEWLLKFGFERHHSDYGNGVIYIKDVPNNNEFKWGVYPFELGSGFIINKSKNLKYVHQLQNLYFALTSEELTIKEK